MRPDRVCRRGLRVTLRGWREPAALGAAAVTAWVLHTPLDRLSDVGERALEVLAFLIIVKLLSDACAFLGLFRWIAGGLEWCGRRSRAGAFVALGALAAVVTCVLSLDATVVLVTPVAIGLARRLGRAPLSYALLCLWLANAGSLLFPIANLTNLLALRRLTLSTLAFAHATLAAQAAVWALCAASAGAVAWWASRRREPERAAKQQAGLLAGEQPLLAPRWALLSVASAAVAVLLGVAPWLAALGALLVCAAAVARHGGARAVPELLRGTPWRPALLALALFVVVAAVQDVVVAHLGPALPAHGGGRRIGLALSGIVAANATNNLPAYLALEPLAHGAGELWALLAAVNIAPMLTPWGSLANLLWLDACRSEGLAISPWRMVAWSAPLAVLGTAAAVALLPA